MNYILLKDLPDAKAGETLEQYDEDTYKIGKHYWTADIVTSMSDWFAPMHSYSEIRIKALEEQLAKISAEYAKLEAQQRDRKWTDEDMIRFAHSYTNPYNSLSAKDLLDLYSRQRDIYS